MDPLQLVANQRRQLIPVKTCSQAQASASKQQSNFELEHLQIELPAGPSPPLQTHPPRSGDGHDDNGAERGPEAGTMNSLHASPAVRLVFGVSHLGVRQVQVQQLRQLRQQVRPAASSSSTYSSPEPETTKRKPQEAAENSIDGEKKEKTGAEDGRVNGHRPGHGREIWIHNHIRDGHIMFAFDRVIDVCFFSFSSLSRWLCVCGSLLKDRKN
jgi:hypothetical protein